MHLPTSSSPPWDLPAPSYPPLPEDRDAEVVVVGGGIAGLTTAALLTAEGRDVVVLEARTVGSGTSGHTTAKASALQGTRYEQLARLHGADTAARYARAQLAGLAWMARRASGAPDARWRRRTAITYATTPSGRVSLEQEATAAAAAGLPVAFDAVDLPFAVSGALCLPDQGDLDPGPYLAKLAADVDGSPNGTVHEHTRVTGIHGLRGQRVVTERGTIHARHVVMATLLPITDRGLFFARAKPASSYLVALECDGPLPTGMYLSADEPTRSLRTALHRDREVLLVGGGGHDTGRGRPTLARYDQLVDWTTAHFDVTQVVARWSAHDYIPADHLPWVGPASPFNPHVLVATGFEKWGMTMGTAAALALADRILDRTGETSTWAGTFDPKRVSPTGLATTARLNATVASRMASDWLRPDAPAIDGSGRRRRSGLLPVGEPEPGGERVQVVCTHLGGVCSWNDGERTWDCPLHGSRFEADGTVLTAPATTPLRRIRRSDDGDQQEHPVPEP